MKYHTDNGIRLIYDFVCESSPLPKGHPFTDQHTAASHFVRCQAAGHIPTMRECLVVMLLDARHRPIGLHVASIGNLNSAMVHPREIYRPAIAAAAHCIMIMHNHPSGDLKPSAEDLRVTKRIQEAGELLGIQCLDHLVIASPNYYSFVDGRVRALTLGGDDS